MQGALDYDRHGTGVCDMACSGDEEFSCGGEYSFDMYKLEWPEPSDDEEYVGCFVDAKDDRIMDNMITDDNMTPQLCRDHCENTYSIYYGVEVRGTSDQLYSFLGVSSRLRRDIDKLGYSMGSGFHSVHLPVHFFATRVACRPLHNKSSSV